MAVVVLLSATGLFAIGCNCTPTTVSCNSTATTVSFTFFLHDNLLTIPSSAEVLILPELDAPKNSFFGALIVFDDSMTKSPDPGSLEIGRGRGMYLFDAHDTKGAAIEFVWTAQFNESSGYGKGATLSFLGFDRTTDPTREISVVGGTGLFRSARGWAIIQTYSLVGAAAVLNITVTVTYGQ